MGTHHCPPCSQALQQGSNAQPRSCPTTTQPHFTANCTWCRVLSAGAPWHIWVSRGQGAAPTASQLCAGAEQPPELLRVGFRPRVPWHMEEKEKPTHLELVMRDLPGTLLFNRLSEAIDSHEPEQTHTRARGLRCLQNCKAAPPAPLHLQTFNECLAQPRAHGTARHGTADSPASPPAQQSCQPSPEAGTARGCVGWAAALPKPALCSKKRCCE